MTLDIDAAADSEEIEEAHRHSRARVIRWRTRTLYSTFAFFLSFAAVVLFSDLGPFHSYWNPVGEIFLFLWLLLLLVFVCCGGLWLSAWFVLRDLEKTYL